jgi:hypothetical protein
MSGTYQDEEREKIFRAIFNLLKTQKRSRTRSFYMNLRIAKVDLLPDSYFQLEA